MGYDLLIAQIRSATLAFCWTCLIFISPFYTEIMDVSTSRWGNVRGCIVRIPNDLDALFLKFSWIVAQFDEIDKVPQLFHLLRAFVIPCCFQD